jgi:hypothetical protein
MRTAVGEELDDLDLADGLGVLRRIYDPIFRSRGDRGERRHRQHDKG